MRLVNFLKHVIGISVKKLLTKGFCGIVLCIFVFSCARTDEEVPEQKPQMQNFNQYPSEQYYYGQPGGQVPYQQAPQPYYYQQPQSYYPPVAPYQPQGGSRYYSNPYAIPPSSQYPYYDADQYYVPPTYYNNVERQQYGNPGGNRNSVLSGAGASPM